MTEPRSRRSRTERASSRSYRRVGIVVLAMVLTAVGGALLWSRARQGGAPGSIVLISIDTLRADHLPAYGYAGVKTPAIDGLASDGVVFERAYSHSPQTLPSHASIFSGRLPFEHGVRDNVGFSVGPGERLLPAMLHDRGFATAGFPSAFVLRKESGISRGFDEYDSEMPPAAPDASMGMVQRAGSRTLELAAHWLSGHRSAPFFLFVHFYEPHKPYRPPERYARRYPQPYDGEIAYADELVGCLIQQLKDLRLYDRSTIVLLSDHGEGLGDHGEHEHGVFLYDESLRVPLIVKLPGERSHGRRVRAPVQHIDIVPTLLALARAPVPRTLRGRSLVPAMEGQDSGLADRSIYSETLYPRYHFGWSELYALTGAQYRYILAPKPELYDLGRDPGEKQNIHAGRAQTVSSMRAELERFVKGREIARPKAVSAADLERFQSLGYVGLQSEAAGDGEATIRADPKDKIGVLEMYRAAVNLRGDRRLGEAAALLKRIVDEDPAMLDVWAQLAQVEMRMGRLAEGVQALKRVVALKPDSTESLLGIATAEIRLGQLEDAKKHAELALAATPARAHEALARIELARGNVPGALAEAQRAQETDPTLPMPSYIQGLALYNKGRYAEALPLFQKALDELRPRNLELKELHYYTADTLAQLDRYPEAEAEFKRELEKFPENSRARASLGLLYFTQGRRADAHRQLADIIRVTPAPDSYALVARTLTIVGDKAAAAQVVARGLRDFPQSLELKALLTRTSGRSSGPL